MARTKQSARPRTIHPKPLEPLPPGTQAILRSGIDAVAYHIPTSPNPPPLSPPDSSTPALKTTILLPKRSTWTSGFHFHTTYTEYLRLIQGCITVRLGSSIRTISAKAGGQVDYVDAQLKESGLVIRVDKGVRHEWGRADWLLSRRLTCVKRTLPKDYGDDVVVEEWTDPSDVGKPLFFWNLNGVILTPSGADMGLRKRWAKWILGIWWIPFQLFVIFWELDNWPVFLSLEGLWKDQLGDKVGGRLESGAEYAMTVCILCIASIFARLINVKAVAEERTPPELWVAWQKAKGFYITDGDSGAHNFMFEKTSTDDGKNHPDGSSTAAPTRKSARLRGMEPRVFE